MTGRRISSIVLSILGFLSMIAGVIVILWGMQAEPVILREPEKARQCAEGFLKAIDAGINPEVRQDFSAFRQLLENSGGNVSAIPERFYSTYWFYSFTQSKAHRQ